MSWFSSTKVVKSRIGLLLFFSLEALATAFGADAARNLALAALGAKARSWEPGVAVVPEHEPSKCPYQKLDHSKRRSGRGEIVLPVRRNPCRAQVIADVSECTSQMKPNSPWGFLLSTSALPGWGETQNLPKRSPVQAARRSYR